MIGLFFDLGVVSLEKSLHVLKICKKMSRYFLEKSMIFDHRIAESHIKILVHILVLISDTFEKEADQTGKAKGSTGKPVGFKLSFG